MFQQITKGIKVSVRTRYNGITHRGYVRYYAFSYFITIENKSENTVQLLERYWEIFDALNNIERVSGEGVVGQTPIIKPNDIYNYQSNCLLLSPIGAMGGKYKMINLTSSKKFFATIPTFQLTTISTKN
ncbi:Co2+/Mg2+ efflux protein ApaG [Tenacibaculum sp. 190524A02b]|uniref:ApaG protein n=1 Tax=Tenacibaculum vairaonense TaxID=3137860 RepID=A0ABM9PLH5_9FLAO